MKTGLALSIVLLNSACHAAAGPVSSAARPAVEDQVKDRFVSARYERQRIGGLLGERLRMTIDRGLLGIDAATLMAALRSGADNPTRNGDSVGIFLRAASNAWAYSRDERLKAVLDELVQALVSAQSPNGHLRGEGARYRWTGWDFPVHSRNLMGLLAYHLATGAPSALQSARGIADLLTRTLGSSQNQADPPGSPAYRAPIPTSLLEPVCLLYRYSGEKRNLASLLVRAYDRQPGPRLLSGLLESGSVMGAAGATASEVLDGLVGLLELYRLSGDERYLQPALAAWRDVVTKRRYVTGTTSAGRQFKADYVLPGEESANVGESGVTASWLQLNWHLLRLTGQPQYGDELERTIYNQLLGAQDPRDGGVCPFTPLAGKKRPEQGASSSRASHALAITLIPQMIWGTREGGLAVVLYAPGEATVSLGDGGPDVVVNSQTGFPKEGTVTLTLRPPAPARFPVFLRVPSWCGRYRATVAGSAVSGRSGEFMKLERVWNPGDKIEIDMDLTVQFLPGGPSYPNRVAVQRGPQVLALDAEVNPGVPFLHRVAPTDGGMVQLTEAAKRLPKSWLGSQAYATPAMAVQRAENGRQTIKRTEVVLVPFADARRYLVWLTKPDKMPFGPVAVTAFGTESWSRAGNHDGSICDERSDTFRVTYNGTAATEDWYAVEMDNPELISRVVYRHGRVFPNGGWFSTSRGKPAIQIKRSPTSDWETVGTLESYPQTSATVPPTLYDGQSFQLKLKEAVTASAVRIVGRPGGAFSSCAELAAYGP